MHFGIYNVTSSVFATLNGLARWRIDLTLDARYPPRRAVGRAQ
jgi:hypothetical protein